MSRGNAGKTAPPGGSRGVFGGISPFLDGAQGESSLQALLLHQDGGIIVELKVKIGFICILFIMIFNKLRIYCELYCLKNYANIKMQVEEGPPSSYVKL